MKPFTPKLGEWNTRTEINPRMVPVHGPFVEITILSRVKDGNFARTRISL